MSGSILDSIDWQEVDRRLLQAKKPYQKRSGMGYAWLPAEEEILRHALEQRMSAGEIYRSGVLPGRTSRAIVTKAYHMRMDGKISSTPKS